MLALYVGGNYGLLKDHVRSGPGSWRALAEPEPYHDANENYEKHYDNRYERDQSVKLNARDKLWCLIAVDHCLPTTTEFGSVMLRY